MQERREEREHGKDVHLRDAQQLGRVHEIPVSKLVPEDRFHFLGLALLDERIKDNDVFALYREPVRTGWMRQDDERLRTQGRPKK